MTVPGRFASGGGGLSPQPVGIGGWLARLPPWFLLPGGGPVLSGDIVPAIRLRGFGPATRDAAVLAAEHLSDFAIVVLGLAGLIRLRRMSPSLRNESLGVPRLMGWLGVAAAVCLGGAVASRGTRGVGGACRALSNCGTLGSSKGCSIRAPRLRGAPAGWIEAAYPVDALQVTEFGSDRIVVPCEVPTRRIV